MFHHETMQNPSGHGGDHAEFCAHHGKMGKQRASASAQPQQADRGGHQQLIEGVRRDSNRSSTVVLLKV